MNTLQQFAVYEGAFIAVPDGFIVRGVFDHMGTHAAHIEYPLSNAGAHSYRIKAQLGGPIEPHAVYLGAVAEVYGSHVVHYYAVPQ